MTPMAKELFDFDLGLRKLVLSDDEITSQSRGQDYLSVMSANLAALRKAGGCS